MDELDIDTKRQIRERGLTTKQAAAYIGLSRKTLDNYRSLNKGPYYYTYLKGIIYDPLDLDAFLDAKMVQVKTDYFAMDMPFDSRCKGDLSDEDAV